MPPFPDGVASGSGVYAEFINLGDRDPMTSSALVTQHYGGDAAMGDRLDDALESLSRDDGLLASPEDTAALDQFHVGGLDATKALAQLLAPSTSSRVLDIGSGLGGPSRYLAQAYDCRLLGVDLTERYCRVAMRLARRAGFERDALMYGVADATRVPLATASFHAAWSQHVSMNIADKAAYYADVHRVVEPRGRFAFHDVVQGPSGAIHFPVPWARTPAISHLQTGDAMRRTIEEAGFACVAWHDVTPAASQFLDQVIARGGSGAMPRLGLHLLLGAALPRMLHNFRQNIVEGRCGLVQAVFERVA
jgi:SAM-dependent methyltransferase